MVHIHTEDDEAAEATEECSRDWNASNLERHTARNVAASGAAKRLLLLEDHDETKLKSSSSRLHCC